jgi:hypothetical protein
MQDVEVLDAELWASGWLGQAWVSAPLDKREPEKALCAEVARKASSHPSRHGLAAVAALCRVAPDSSVDLLQETSQLLAETQAAPAYADAPSWTPVAGWRAVDVWEFERLLFVEFDGPNPHTLVASVQHVGGVVVNSLAVLKPGAATTWESLREQREIPMPLSDHPAEEVLAELASALRQSDMLWPRLNGQDFVDDRALAWARCVHYLDERPQWEPLPDADRTGLIDDYILASRLPDDDVTRSLADLFLDYGDGYLGARPLGWSPAAVMLFLTNWLPRKAILDVEQRAGLPEALRGWLRFALERRGVAAKWIDPVVKEVDACLADFAAASDDKSSWGPAKTLATELEKRDVDLDDRAAVDAVIRALNAEQPAQRPNEE